MATLANRVRLLYPMLGFKWCLIMLNPFRSASPDRLLEPQVLREVRARQLARSPLSRPCKG